MSGRQTSRPTRRQGATMPLTMCAHSGRGEKPAGRDYKARCFCSPLHIIACPPPPAPDSNTGYHRRQGNREPRLPRALTGWCCPCGDGSSGGSACSASSSCPRSPWCGRSCGKAARREGGGEREREKQQRRINRSEYTSCRGG